MTDPHMSPDAFRRHGHEVVEWIARYFETVDEMPVQSRSGPGDVAAALPPNAPETGESFDAMLRDVDEIIMPGVTHWQSPRFHAYFPANVSGPAVLGEMLSAGLGVQGMLWATSPACTELETRVLDWLVPMLGLPDAFLSSGSGGGVIQDTASSACLCALLAARERTLGGSGNERGLHDTGTRLAVYASDAAHSSIDKAVRIAGLGIESLRRIPGDDRFAMRADALAEAMARDRAAGVRPCFVMATCGTTACGAFDPLAPVADACREHDAWLHVDAAMFGTAALCEEFRWTQAGVERADSYCFNPHKWMFTNFDCDCFWLRDRAALVSAMSILPEYLRNEATESGDVIDYRDWQVPLGRRFRALKLWFVIRHYGIRGLQEAVRTHVALAQRLAEWIDADDRFEIAAPHPLNLVCFRHVDGDDATRRIMESTNAGGETFLSHAMLDGRRVIRLCVGQTHVNEASIERSWRAISTAAQE